MFSYEEYYKLFNARSDARYHENVLKLREHLNELSHQGEGNGFRERMMKFSRELGQYLSDICGLEEKWDDAYRKAASMKELKEDQEAMFGKLKPEKYLGGFMSPMYMNQQARDIGPVLSMFAVMFASGVEDAIKHRRFMLSEKIDVYFELHKRISKGQVRAENLASLYNEQIHAGLDRSLELWMNHRYAASEEYYSDIVRYANLNEPYYLYEMGLPVGETEEKWRTFLQGADEALLNELAEKAAERFAGGMYKEAESPRGYRRYEAKNQGKYEFRSEQDDHVAFDVDRNLVAVDYPMGMELLARKVMEKLEERGYVPFIRDIRTTDISRVFLRDHEGDMIRALKEDKILQMGEAAKALAANNKNLLKGYAGCVRIVLQERQDYNLLVDEMRKGRQNGGHGQRLSGRYSIGAAEEKRKKTREFWKNIEAAMTAEGGMEVGSEVTICLPAMRDEENFASFFEAWSRLIMKDLPAERPLKAFQDAMERGNFLYLQGQEQAEESEGRKTDLLLAFYEVKDPAANTRVQVSRGEGAMPGGYVYTIPAKEETSGTLFLEKTVIDGVEYHDLSLVFEDGMLTKYSCSNGENEEESQRFIRDNLLKGADEAVISEVALGLGSGAWTAFYEGGLDGELPEEVRAGFDVSIVLGESRFERNEFLHKNNLSHKMMCLEEAKQDVKPEEKPEEKPADAQVQQEKGEENRPEAPEVQEKATAEEASQAVQEKAQTEKPQTSSEAEETAENVKRRRYTYPLRTRINIPYAGIENLRVINENGSANDILRKGVFVLIGTDQMNMLRQNK